MVISHEPFSGSYASEEVLFLLRRMRLKPTALEEREQLIQSGKRHYSEMIGPEDAPTRGRFRIQWDDTRTRPFHTCCRNGRNSCG